MLKIEKIGKPNNSKIFRSKKTKRHKKESARISQNQLT
jgi:hypothetical protein